MCCNANCGCHGRGCNISKICKWLLIIGGINWGLIGVGMLLGSMNNWNIVSMIFATMPTVAALVYVLVGIAAVMKLFGCKCKKCMGNVCMPDGKMDGGMQGKM